MENNEKAGHIYICDCVTEVNTLRYYYVEWTIANRKQKKLGGRSLDDVCVGMPIYLFIFFG